MTMSTETAGAPRLNLHLQQLAYLRELERAGTVTEAARRLDVSQPALSQALSELERRLGVPLFERRGRRRELTEAGREVARFANEVLGRAGELERWLRARRAGEAGTLRIGMIDAASLYVLPGTIRAFRHAHPAVLLELVVGTTADLLEGLERYELDIAFVVGPVPDAFQTHDVLVEPLYLYRPPGEALPVDGAGSAEDDGGEQDWMLYPVDSQTRALIDEGLARRGLRPHVTLESGNPAILRQMVALGLGWSVLPSTVAEIGEPRLVRADARPIAERALLAAWRADVPVDPRAERFLELATSEARVS